MDGSSIEGDRNYSSALEFLYGRINYERTARGVPSDSNLNLDRMRRLLDELGNPQKSLQAIHIAGTKGKGSTAAMIGAAMKAAGYRVGLFTSPHLERLEERVRINDVDCSASDLVKLVHLVRPVIAKLDAESRMGIGSGSPTFFEILTAMAMLHFTLEEVDVAILEVGLGGRLDSTNLCHPIATVITSISFDHTQQLGNTLSAIAREKAGIIKPNVPLICGVSRKEALDAIMSIAKEHDAPTWKLGEEFDFQYTAPTHIGTTDSNSSIEYRDLHLRKTGPLEHVFVGMRGIHQGSNAAIAIATLRRLQVDGWDIPMSAIRQGVMSAKCQSRIEIVSEEPLVVLDTAHNIASIDALLSVLDESFSSKRRILIFAATRDKDVSGMLRRLLPHFDAVILTRYLENPRGVEPAKILELAKGLQDDSNRFDITTCQTPAEAWQEALSMAKQDDLLCVTGSFYLAVEMRSMIVAHSSHGKPETVAPQSPCR